MPLFGFFLSFGQVGINTTSPQATLDINGDLKIANTADVTTSNKLLGICDDGYVTNVKVGTGLSLSGNELNALGDGDPTIYKIAHIPMNTTMSNQNFNNLNLDLSGLNKNKVIFRLVASHNYTITGITGGIDGRHLIIYNSSAVNLTIDSMSGLSSPMNRIDTLGSSTATSGVGTIEMVYDGTSSKWIVINIRD